MNIDFHTHGKLAKKLPFSSCYTHLLFQEARAAGLDAICLTEHFNSPGLEELYEFISNTYERVEDCFMVEGLKVFPGLEIDVQEGGHILAIGAFEKILCLNAELEAFRDSSGFIPFADLIQLTKSRNILIGGAHPFRAGSHLSRMGRNQLKQLNFLDFNGKDYALGHETAREEILNLSSRLGIPVLAGSDTHQALQYACVWNVFEKDTTSLMTLQQMIEEGRYVIRISESIDHQVKSAGQLKKALKEMHKKMKINLQ